MAFDDAKKAADRLRIKNVGIFDQGDPTALRDVCWSPWCGQWVEDMRPDHRCHTEACDKRLWQEAIKRKMAVKLDDGTIIGCVEPLLEKKTWEVPPEYMPVVKDHMCVSCQTEVARPKEVLCNRCKIAGKAKDYGERRLKAIGRKRGRGLTHRIKGLDKL